MPVILINETFKKYIINQPAAVRNKIKKQFEFLEIGSWDGSLNVKKVKGTSSNKTVFEARLDRSNRILFTLGTDDSYEQSGLNIFIYIWGIVTHDDISLKSKNIIPKNAPFLNFIPYSQSESKDLFFEALDGSCFTQEWITNKISDDSGSQKWHQLNERDWQRIELYVKDEFELFLYMTPGQWDVLKSAPPILLSGTAGSGKTTIAVYYLLKESLSKSKKIFITYNKFLKNSSEKLFNGLVNSSKASAGFIQPEFYTYKDFCLNITESVNRYFNHDKEINYEKFSSLLRTGFPSGGKNSARLDTPLIWEEIRSIIKGALPQLNAKLFESALQKIKAGQLSAGLINSLQRQFNVFANLESAGKIEHIVQRYMRMNIQSLIKNLNNISALEYNRLQSVIESILELFSKQKELTKKKHLSFLEYEMLGKKKAPNFIVNRKVVYQIFEWYQDKLESNKWWDELDLAREAINILSEKDAALEGTDKFLFDVAICDEVQDLTDVQHELLFYIVKNPLNLILTGDTRQIINPSGFRWEELRQHFYSRDLKVPEIKYLNLNFRSSGSIVELSNCLLDIKASLLGLSSDQLLEDWKFKSRPPMVVVSVKESDMIDALITTGAKKTILVRTEKEKEKLKQRLDTELIFTIYEAKGLEFNTVLLWKFCADNATGDLWKNILADEKISFHHAKIKHEINLLYVAITRAQKDLLIYDGSDSSVIWQSEKLSDKIFVSDDVDYLNNIWNVISTPEEWLEQGDYFFEREYYKAAIECYKNANAAEPLSKASAYYNEKQGNFLEAAKYFEQQGAINRAIVNYEKASSFADALKLWTLLEDKEKIFECTLKVYEAEGRYSELGRIYLDKKQFKKAADYFIKGGAFEDAALLFAGKLKDKSKAASYFEAAGSPDKAAKIYMKLKNYSKAADLFEKAGDLNNAISCLKKIKNESRLISIYYKTNNFDEIIKIYVAKKDVNGAVKIIKKNYPPEEIEADAKSFFNSRKIYPAYVRYMAVNNKLGIAECSFKLKNYKEAAFNFESAGEMFSAGRAYEKHKNYGKAFLCYMKSQKDKEAGYYNAEIAAGRLNWDEISDHGKYFFANGQYQLALKCTEINMDSLNEGICYYMLDNIKEAAESWSLCFLYDRLESVAEFCLNKKQIDLFAGLILNAGEWKFKNPENKIFINAESPVVKIMDIYFENAHKILTKEQAADNMAKWAERLFYFDKKNAYTEKIINCFDKSGRHNGFFSFLVSVKKNYFMHRSYLALTEHFRKNPEKFKEVNENSLIRLYILNLTGQFKEMVEKLEINGNNYLLFLSSNQKEKALKYLLTENNEETIVTFLVEFNEYQNLAQFYESKPDLKNAAKYYQLSKEYKKAAELWAKLEEYNKSGNMYFKMKDFSKALEMYEKRGKINLKAAEAHMALGNYSRAADIYKQLRRPNLLRKALKLNMAGNSLSALKSTVSQPGLFDDAA